MGLSSVALVTMFLSASGNPANAGECVETDPTNSPGDYLCSGAADTANDVRQDLTGETIYISVEDGFGIDTTGQGGNALTITSEGGLTFLDHDDGSTITGAELGIEANSTGAGNISITTNGSITADSAGIKADSVADGDITITSTGDVMSTNGKGILARLGTEDTAGSHSGNLTINSNNVDAMHIGIDVINYYSGNISITSTGTIESQDETGIFARLGIDAIAGEHSGNLTISTNNVYAMNHGIEVNNFHRGDTSITSSGNVESTDARGIFAILGNAATAGLHSSQTTIITNNVEAKANGIEIRHYHSGEIRITSSGLIKSHEAYGIFARMGNPGATGEYSGDITINANDVDGHIHGVYAHNYFDGYVNITVSGNVSSVTKSGVFIQHFAAGDILVTLEAGSTINAHQHGIFAKNQNLAEGDIDLDVHGNITTNRFNGIYAEARNGNVDIEVTGKLTTGSNGVYAAAFTTEADRNIDIDVTGDIEAGSWGVLSELAGTDKDDDGIVSITTSGTITGSISASDRGAVGAQAWAGSNIVINAFGDLSATIAIRALVGSRYEGNGDINIVATKKVQGTDHEGIYAWIRNNGNITIETGEEEVFGGRRGIYAIVGAGDYGTGDISITVNGDITGGSEQGINFENGATNTLNTNNDITISGGTHDVLGGTGNETINNYGTLTMLGHTDLGEGANAFNNLAGATHISGSWIGLGEGNWYTNHGDLSPGGDGAVQKTFIDGNFRNTGTGKLLVQINSTGSDTLDISGSADLEGGTVVATFENDQDTSLFKRHLILRTQGGLDETSFDDLVSNLDGYQVLYYQNRSAFLTLADPLMMSCDVANTQNQRSVACTGLDSLPLDDELVLIFEAFKEGDDDLVRTAYDALSGEVHPSMKGALAVGLQQQGATVFSRMRDLLSTSSFQNSTTVTASLAIGSGGENGEGGGDFAAIPFGLWTSGYGGWSDVDATGNTAQMEDEYSGFLIGMDGELMDTLKLGFVGGRSRNAVAQDTRNSDGDIDTFTAGFYGGTEFGNVRLRFAGLFSQHSLDTSRRVEILDLNEIVLAEYDATSWQVSAETGYHMEAGSIEWEPFARLSHIGMDIDGYSEQASGLGLTALTAPSEEHSTTFGVVGVRTSISVADWINVHGMAGWRGAWGDTDPTSTFTFNGSAPFIVSGAPISESAFIGEFGAVAQLSPQAAMHVSYTGLQSSDGSDHGIRAKLMMRF